MSSIARSNTGTNVGGRYNTLPPTYVDGAMTELQTDENGNLFVAINVMGNVAGQQVMAGSLPVVIASDQTPLETVGNVADNAADSGNPVKVGGKYVAAPADLTDGDRGNMLLDIKGRLQVRDVTLDALDKNTGAVGANTLRVKLADEDTALLDSLEGFVDGVEALLQTIEDNGDAVEASLSSIDAGIPAALGQDAMAGSMPVVLASNQTAIPTNLQDGSGSAVNKGQSNMAGSLPVTLASDQPNLPVLISHLSVVDQLDTALHDASVSNIQDNAGAFLQVVAALAATVKRIRVADTTGAFIGVYTGAAASEALAFIINPGMDGEIEHAIPSGTRISLRAMDVADITTGNLTMQFLG